MSVDADVVILGGGCAGLSLAVALAQEAPHLHVKVLEPRDHYQRDRTWCFWNSEPHPFSGGVTHRWHAWRVRHAGVVALQHSRMYEYQHLPADNFYGLSQQRLRSAGHELCMSTIATNVMRWENCSEVSTDKGTLKARWVFDSRPRSREDTAPMLEQRFVGWHVKTERACFDPSTVDLMDFQPVTEHGRTAFLYVLPFSATEALVEATYFDVPALRLPNAEELLRSYLARLQSGSYDVLYREASTLAMGETAASAMVHNNTDIGTRGGRVKPSSGYAFLRIQRQSAAIAAALAGGQDIPLRFEPRAYSILDRIFLQAIRRFPNRAPEYFISLFRALTPETTVRFLSETASAREVMQAMLSLPKFDFMRAALRPPGAA
ncbi:lycopene cyclase family protein [Terriglobus sp.]|uniref:lycopene cyclase family protein n=1 Tax=Terriglobus sp. TaxID=1889013 RepID=UPI003AFF7745